MAAADLESRIIELALARGLIGATQVTGCPACEDPLESQWWGPRLTALIRAGHLTHAIVQSLLVDLLQTPTSTVASGPDDEAEPVPEQDLAWKGYRELQLIGSGGQAMVYKARDPQLDRWVALKFPKSGQPRRIAQMLKEARAQAQVVHPNVLKVYEVGEHEGQPFIALQLVEDGHLGQFVSQFTQEQKIRLMAKVADALHAAHLVSLLHLDLKPSNILVSLRPNEEPWPYLTDFGLVRQAAQDGTLAAFGTPHYASPEQITESGRVEKRSDIYSLGATLYCLLAGTTPHNTSDLAALRGADPVPLNVRLPQVHGDLQAIVEKCMQRNPRDRYETAKAVAEDLQRFLEGKPVLARDPTLIYKFRKWVVRNRLLSALSAASLLALMGLGGWSLRSARRHALQVRLADQYGRDVQSMEQLLRLAHLSRIHDRRPAVARVRETMARIEQEMKMMGSDAFGPGSYALGAGHATLGEWEDARKHLDDAWNAQFRTPACARMRGEVLTWFLRKARKALQTQAPEQRARSLKELEHTLQEPALAAFDVARQGGPQAPYQEALIAYLHGDLEKALRSAHTAIQESPWLYDADVLRVEILMEFMIASHAQGRSAEAQAKLDEARALIEQCLQVAPSDPSLWVRAFLIYWNYNMDHPNDPQWLAHARNSLEMALSVDQDHAEAHGWFTMLLTTQAEQAKDPFPLMDQCVQHAEISYRLTPPHRPNAYLGRALGARGIFKLRNGLDGRADMEKAISSLEEAVSKGEPQSQITLSMLVTLAVERRQAALFAGEDPMPWQQKGLELARRNCEATPGNLRWKLHYLSRRFEQIALARALKAPIPPGLDAILSETEAILSQIQEQNALRNAVRRLCMMCLLERAAQRRDGSSSADIQAALQHLAACEASPTREVVLDVAQTCYLTWTALGQTCPELETLLTQGLAITQRFKLAAPDDPVPTTWHMLLQRALAHQRGRQEEVLRTERALLKRADEMPLQAAGIRQYVSLAPPSRPPRP